MAKVAARLEHQAIGMIGNDNTPLRQIVYICKGKLFEFFRDAGSTLPAGKLRKICKISIKWAKRFDHYRLVHMHDKDHEKYQFEQVPRIERELDDMPMNRLVGDVHYMDILVEKNQEPIKVRLIAWMDNSSHFIWLTPVFAGKKTGVTQQNVADSLAQVAFCKHGEIPNIFVLDNGSEYSELARSAKSFANLADKKGSYYVVKTEPYAPQGKGEIEGLFPNLQGFYQSFDGYIGGNRLHKRLASKGRIVESYRHGVEQLERDIADMVNIYNNRPQSGRLNGLSPLRMLEQKIKKPDLLPKSLMKTLLILFSAAADTTNCAKVE